MPFHHNPAYSDDAVDGLMEQARRQRPPFEIIPGMEGLTIDL